MTDRYRFETPAGVRNIITYQVIALDPDGKVVTRWNAKDVTNRIVSAGSSEKDAYNNLLAYIAKKEAGLTPRPIEKL